MRRYRTEIVIPTDRTVVLRLPEGLPEGPATLIVQVDEDPAPTAVPAEDSAGLDSVLDLERGDIEWWEEFDEEGAGSRPGDGPGVEADAPPGPPEAEAGPGHDTEARGPA